MAPRRPRRQPSPPNRARSTGRLPNTDELGDVYSWSGPNQPPLTAAQRARAAAQETSPAKARSERMTTPDVEAALVKARYGDESALLPYKPTPTINPPRPRTLAAGYDAATQTLRVRFRDGTPWEYYGVPAHVWDSFKRVQSPGRFINRVLNDYPYGRGDF